MTRKAFTEDIPAIRALAEIAFPATYAPILSEDQIGYMMDFMYSEESLRRQMEEGVFFLEEGKGYASIRRDGSVDGRPRFHLEKLYVVPEFQGTGLGRLLFNCCLEEARADCGGGNFRLELNVNRSNPALSFYEHLGLRRDRSGDFPIGKGYFMNDYIMVLDV